jgi:hypothetical protein
MDIITRPICIPTETIIVRHAADEASHLLASIARVVDTPNLLI